MSAETVSQQNDFLAELVKSQSPVSVFLINGIRLSGRIVTFDAHVLQLSGASGVQMVYKHAISTVMPNNGESQPHRAEHREKTISYPRRNVTA